MMNDDDFYPGGLTMEQACEVIEWSAILRLPLSAREIYNLSPRGELYHVFEMYAFAATIVHSHFDGS